MLATSAPGDGCAAGTGAVLRRAGRALADALHDALLHSPGGLLQRITVMGQTVGIPHPHPGQLHQTAHFGVRKLPPEREAPGRPGGSDRLLCGPAGVEGTDGILSRLQARDRRERRRTFLRCRRLFRLSPVQSAPAPPASLPDCPRRPSRCRRRSPAGPLHPCRAGAEVPSPPSANICNAIPLPGLRCPASHFAPWAALMSC